MTRANGELGVVGTSPLAFAATACAAVRGLQVVVLDAGEASARWVGEFKQRLDELVAWQVVSQAEAREAADRCRRVAEPAGLADCELVCLCDGGDLATQRRLCDSLEQAVSADTVLACQTGAVPITVLQKAARWPGRFVGMHWAAPPHATRFLELIRGEQTTEETLAIAREWGMRLGKEPVVCHKDIPGTIVNRLAYALYREAAYLLDEGVADAETIDTSLRNTLGLWAASCGPLRWIDLTGGPVAYAEAMARVLPTLATPSGVPRLFEQLAQQQAQGVTNGQGFYTYTPDEARTWSNRQLRHAQLIERWLAEEFPLPSPP